jgi:hypothetical protein
MWFIFGTPPPTIRSYATMAEGTMGLSWGRSGLEVYIEYSLSLTSQDWVAVDGPIAGTNWTLAVPEGGPMGFFRVRTE